MILLNKPITLDHLRIFKTLTIDAKIDMLDQRPGWTYRGPVQNGKIYLSFSEWERNKYYKVARNFSKYRRDNYGFRKRKHSPLDNQLDFLNDEDVANPANWKYCRKFDNDKQHRTLSFGRTSNSSRLDTPAHALFISDDSEWLLETAKKNLEKAAYEVIKVDATISPDGSKSIIMQVEEDTFYTGYGPTMCLAALDLYGKSHDAQYNMKRPSFGIFSKANNVEFTSMVLGEDTLEISGDFYMKGAVKNHDLHRYCSFISKANREHIGKRIGEENQYWGKYNFAEGDYHVVQVPREDGPTPMYI
jgi:hypothetical protein